MLHHRAIAASLGSLTLTAGLLAAASPSTAAEPQTCQGQPATVVASGPEVVGTEGNDVILAVNGGLREVRGLGGDDVICVAPGPTPPSSMFKVDAGAGDDVVDTTATGDSTSITVDLGAGEDRFLGGPGSERVTADAAGSAEDDVVTTGAGRDDVYSGTAGFPNGDTIDLGSGLRDEVHVVGTRLTGPPAKAGGEYPQLFVGDGADSSHSYEIDMAAGQIQRDGADWGRFVSSFRHLHASHSGLVLRGSDQGDYVFASAVGSASTMVDLGAGEDSLGLEGAPRQGDVLDGGSGRDHLDIRAGTKSTSLDLDMTTGIMESDDPTAGAATATVRDFEPVYLKGQRLTVRGTAGSDRISLTGCQVVAEGGKGADTITVAPDHEYDDDRIEDCERPTARMDGGPGNDTLDSVDDTWSSSGGGTDHLRGGRGNDTITSHGGNDRIWGGQGRDEIWAGDGRDKIWAGKGRDHVRGNNGHDQIWGGKGPDDLEGGKGRDQVWGNGGKDLLMGHRHNDRLWGGGGLDEARGGPGRDLCRADKKSGCER